MPFVSRREWEIYVTMNDQTKREREALNRGFGDIEKTVKRATEESKKSIVEIAKHSKQGMEGIKAVLELGGWLMMANQVGKALADVTAEARKNSVEFKAAGTALTAYKNEIGYGMVSALEPVVGWIGQIAKGWAEGAKNARTYAEVMDKIKRGQSVGTEDMFSAKSGRLAEVNKNLAPLQAMLEGGMRGNRSPELEARVAALTTERAALIDSIRSLGMEMGLKKDAADAKAKADAAALAIAPFNDVMREWNTKLIQQSGTVLDVLDNQKGLELASLKAKLKNATEYADAAAKVEEWYGIERTNIANKAAEEALKAWNDGEAKRILAIKAAADREKQDRTDVISGVKEMIEAIRWQKEQQVVTLTKGSEGLGGESGNGFSGIGDMLKTVAQGFIQGGPMGAIMAVVGKFIMSLQNVLSIMAPLFTIIMAIFEVLGPFINNLLAPLVGILRIVGYTIGKLLIPVLDLLRPIIELLAQIFVFLYNNIIVPVVNFVIRGLNMIYNGFVDFINSIIKMMNKIPGVDIDKIKGKDKDAGTLDRISLEDLGGMGTAGGTTGGSASYASGTSIKIDKIEIKADFIAGEAGLMDVAVMIRDLITEAERIGR